MSHILVARVEMSAKSPFHPHHFTSNMTRRHMKRSRHDIAVSHEASNGLNGRQSALAMLVACAGYVDVEGSWTKLKPTPHLVKFFSFIALSPPSCITGFTPLTLIFNLV
ncbi:hypothetical protein L218DRAFT_951348 [Marasmius fiardii PR-910]|nr:hypothetical protein L218DRAFT_951348 [Marasmius fiardii PR-910]